MFYFTTLKIWKKSKVYSKQTIPKDLEMTSKDAKENDRPVFENSKQKIVWEVVIQTVLT